LTHETGGVPHNPGMTHLMTVIAMLGLGALSLPGTASDQDPAERLKVASRLEFDEGKRSEAAAIYREVLAQNPSSFDAHLGLGRILVVEGSVAEGQQHLEKALASASDNQRNPARSTLAISYVFEGNGAAAAKLYQQVFESQLKANAAGPAANTANALARTLLETGDLDNAEKWYRTGYETAAKIQNEPPEEADIWEMRWRHAQGRIAARRKQFDAARAHLAAVEALVAKGTLPEDQRAFAPQLAGYVAFYQGHYDEAIAALATANQEDPFVLGLLARAYEQKKETDKARELYTRVLAQPGFSLQLALTRPLAARRVAGQ
jgi:tetratricopeptide (TPR) repeat protein